MAKLLRFLWRPAVALWGTVGALALYFLMAGPVVLLFWNVNLPDWFADAMLHVYSPLNTLSMESSTVQTIWKAYIQLWVNLNVQPATQTRLVPDPPLFFLQFADTLLGAWLVWNFVRLMNQRKVAAP